MFTRALLSATRRGRIATYAPVTARAGPLLISYAAELARRRRARGLRLNHPEAVALITDHILEGVRDGRTVAELMNSGREMLYDVQAEATFPDGTKLVTVHHPIV